MPYVMLPLRGFFDDVMWPTLVVEITPDYAKELLDLIDAVAKLNELAHIYHTDFMHEGPMLYWYKNWPLSEFQSLGSLDSENREEGSTRRRLWLAMKAERCCVVPHQADFEPDVDGFDFEEFYGRDDVIKPGTETCRVTAHGVSWTALVHPTQVEIYSREVTPAVLRMIAEDLIGDSIHVFEPEPFWRPETPAEETRGRHAKVVGAVSFDVEVLDPMAVLEGARQLVRDLFKEEDWEENYPEGPLEAVKLIAQDGVAGALLKYDGIGSLGASTEGEWLVPRVDAAPAE